MEDTRITSTSSHQYLVVNNEEGLRNNQIRRTNSSESRVITKREWITVIVLCYVNLINYMDRFTIPGKIQTVLHRIISYLFSNKVI